MSDNNIIIKTRSIPTNPRSKNYPVGSTVIHSGGGSTSVTIGGGTSIDILKTGDLGSLTEKNVFSSLRTLAEILSVIIKKDDTESELSDANTFSSLRIIQEINNILENKGKDLFLSKTNDDQSSGLITFLKGLTSEELIEANNGLVVRNQELVEAALMSLTEEGEDALVEEIKTSSIGAATLGELDNVTDDADTVSDTNDILIRLAGAQEWSINTTLFSQVSQLMTKVFPFSMSLNGGGTYEKGSTQTIKLSWTYDRDIETQSVNNESLSIDIRAKQYTGVTTDTTYILKAIQGGQTYTKSVSAQFKVKKYYGVSANKTLTNDEILALSSTWAQRVQSTTVFDCTGGKYPFYILPTSMVSGIQFWIGGLRNTDWLEEVQDVTNASGYTESYTIFRLNSIQTGVLNIEVR